MANCIAACLRAFFGNLGWFAIAAIVACIIGGGFLGGPAGVAICLGFAVGGAVLIGLMACIKNCAPRS